MESMRWIVFFLIIILSFGYYYYNLYIVESGDDIRRSTQVLQDDIVNIVNKNNELLSEMQAQSELLVRLKTDMDNTMAINNQIEMYEVMSGRLGVEDRGVFLTIDTSINSTWMVDLIHEVNNLGAKFIAINDILYDGTSGFLDIKSGEISYNDVVLIPPYEIKIIGDADTIYSGLLGRLGVLNRMEHEFNGLKYYISKEENIIIDAKPF